MTARAGVASWGGVGALALGLVARAFVFGGVAFSPADEGHYLAAAARLAAGGVAAFPDLVRDYLETPALHVYPSPLRYGYLLLAALSCRLGGAGFDALAALSTFASIATLAITAALAARVAGRCAASIATLLLALSPLQLALGRRALQDAVVVCFAASALLAWILARAAVDRASHWRRGSALAVALALLCAMKETSLLLLVPFGALELVDTRSDRTAWGRLVAIMIAPVLAFGGFLALGGHAGDAWALLRIVERSASAPYVVAYMSGAPQRVLVDLTTLLPITVFLAAQGFVRRDASGGDSRPVVVFLVATLALAAGLPKNVRFTAVVEPALAIVAARGLTALADEAEGSPRRRAIVAGTLALASASGWFTFERVFLSGAVYDPTTYDMLVALDAVPHPGRVTLGTLPGAVIALLGFGVALLVALGVRGTYSKR